MTINLAPFFIWLKVLGSITAHSKIDFNAIGLFGFPVITIEEVKFKH